MIIFGDIGKNVYICNIILKFQTITTMFIPCMCCGRELPDNWSWWVCDKCGYRVCPSCFPSYKCPKCTWGWMKRT